MEIQKVTRSDAHDRLIKFKEQTDYIGKGCQDCIDNRPPEITMPFYIFAHTRTVEADERISIYQDDVAASLYNAQPRKYRSIEEVPSSRLIWAPRLTKPKAQTNSMLFKAYPGTDNVRPIWIIPAQELWGQYEKDKLSEQNFVAQCIFHFVNNRALLEKIEDDDLSEEEANRVRVRIGRGAMDLKHQREKKQHFQEFKMI